jgi:hypothetical protein
MPAETTNELRDFNRFLSDKLDSGGVDWSPEEALDHWRQQHPDHQASEDDMAAIQEALADLAAGDRGIPFEDFERDFCKRHNLPHAS